MSYFAAMDLNLHDDEVLYKVIADLVKRKRKASFAECLMLNRVLCGLRENYEAAGDMWESMDTTWDTF
jgi:hypothetical protein